MNITAALVKEVRDKSGAGMMDAKKALVEAEGDVQKAMDILREKGLASVAKKANRLASEGIVASYIHGGRIGVLVEVNSETDFVAKNEDFQEFARNVAMHVAALNPKYLKRDEVPAEEVEHEKNILREQALNEGKPEHIVEKMIAGRMEKFYEEICLMDQKYIKDGDKTIQDLQNDIAAKIGENINIRRFVRFEVGEGMEKKEEDFAEEVAKQIGK